MHRASLRRTAEITHTTDPHCGQAPGWPWRRVLKLANSNPSADCVHKGGKAPTIEPVPGLPVEPRTTSSGSKSSSSRYTSVFSIWFTSNGSSCREDLAQGGGEGTRLAGLTVFAAEEATVVAREGDRRDPEPFGHGRARTAGQLLAGLGADADHDTGRRRAQGIEV